MVQLLLKNVFQLWIKTQLVLLFVFFTLFQPPFNFSHLHSFLSVLNTYFSGSCFLTQPSFNFVLFFFSCLPYLPLFQSLSSLMALHVNLSGLVYFAASCYSSSEVTPHRGIRTLPHLRPYLPHLISLHLFATVLIHSRLKAAMWEQKINARTTVQIVLV